MSFEEFKGICFHTQYYLRVPALNMRIDKVQYLMTKGRFDFKKEEKLLKELYEKNKTKLEKL